MGIRSKLLVPLVLMGASFAAILHLYWLPEFRASETVQLQKRELSHMDVIASALISPLLSGDLAQIHATLDQLMMSQDNWNAMRLKSADGVTVYPVESTADARQEYKYPWLTSPIEFDGKLIGTLELNVDIDVMLASPLASIQKLEGLLLSVLACIILLAALLQDRWIRRPLKTLSDATSNIAHGNYGRALPKASSNDEVGKLIRTIDSMRGNLANRERKLAEHHTLLNAISAAQSRFIRDADVISLFNNLLMDILSMSGSEYGFIGEVLYRDGRPYLKTLAISNIAWDDDTRKFYEENAPRGLEFTNLDTLFGASIKNSEVVIANNPANDPRSSGSMPPGHPPLNAFLGIPFFRGDKVIGMFGVANRASGYDLELVEFLEPITSTCTQIVEALKTDRQRELSEEQLRERETRMRTIFENVVDGIITTNERGIIESFNRAAENMFGYTADEVIGKNVSILTPPDHRPKHDGYINDYLGGRESRIMGTGREVRGVRKDGSTFPIDIAITEMWLGKERHFCSIMRDITERKKVDRMKNEFVSTVSHELRTPLTSIRGALGLVGSGTAGELPDKAQPLVDIATKNCDRLIRLINDILDIEKIEADKMEFDIQPLELMPLVTQVIQANQPFAAEHGASITCEDSAPGTVVLLDEDRFTQALTNLISNAAKFSPEGGTIGIAISEHNGGVRVSVSDQGPGIPPEFRGRIFSKFSQADSSDTRQRGGTGLGLNITRAIIEKLDGQVSFDTKTDVGTTFHIDLPVYAGAEKTSDDTAGQQHEAPGMATRVLVCEDEADIAHLLRLMLESNGYSVDIARSAAEAKTLLDRHEYALMTLDLMLPDQNGMDLFSDIRDNEKTRHLPVVVVSAVADREAEKLSGDAVQIIDWIGKPIDENRLINAVAGSIDPASTVRPHILHVEDEGDVREIVSSMIGESYRLCGASTLAEARRELSRRSFDLVILDLGLPDGSGLSLLPLLAETVPPVPVLLFSVTDVGADIATNVSATLVKSKTTNETLMDTIHSTIAGHPRLAKEAS